MLKSALGHYYRAKQGRHQSQTRARWRARGRLRNANLYVPFVLRKAADSKVKEAVNRRRRRTAIGVVRYRGGRLFDRTGTSPPPS
jgi:hypothetical protein